MGIPGPVSSAYLLVSFWGRLFECATQESSLKQTSNLTTLFNVHGGREEILLWKTRIEILQSTKRKPQRELKRTNHQQTWCYFHVWYTGSRHCGLMKSSIILVETSQIHDYVTQSCDKWLTYNFDSSSFETVMMTETSTFQKKRKDP